MTTTREELYLKTGFIIMEVMGELTRTQINILRTEHGLSEITKVQMKNAIENELAKHDWEDFEEEE